MKSGKRNVESDAKKTEEAPRKAAPSRWRRRGRFLWRGVWVYVLASLALSFIPERPLQVDVVEREAAALSGELSAGAGDRKSVV